MNKWLGVAVILSVLVVSFLFFLNGDGPDRQATETPGAIEARIIEYLDKNIRPGEPVLITELHNKVFTADDERAVLQRLYEQFFLIPATAAQMYQDTGKIPTLQQLSDHFQFRAPGTLNVLLRVMESDPRVPRFFTRDPSTGEITSIDIEQIVAEERFGRPLRGR